MYPSCTFMYPSIATFVPSSYVGAISTACGIAVGLSVLLQRATAFKPTTRVIVQKFVPFPAVAAASVSNCVLMRYSELKEGIQVKDQEGNVIGNSKEAAKKVRVNQDLARVFPTCAM